MTFGWFGPADPIPLAYIRQIPGVEGIVSPGFNPRVVDYCLEHEVPIIPGICTPTETERAVAAVAQSRGKRT
jgi:2-keto-3-deoxy-6-phosphogluconate aldolase